MKDSVGECSDTKQQQYLWKAIWKMRVPNKIKFFAWRLRKESLLTQQNLSKKNILTEGVCCFCKRILEDIPNAILHCQSIKKCWSEFMPMMGNLDPQQSMMKTTLQLRSGGNSEELAIFLSVAWGIWYRRNKMVHDKETLDPRQVIEHALSLQRSFSVCKDQPVLKAKEHFRWNSPLAGILKLNVDGAMFRDPHRARVGVVLRDERGDILMAASILDPAVDDPESIELLAIF